MTVTLSVALASASLLFAVAASEDGDRPAVVDGAPVEDGAPRTGAPGLGDALLPTLGNGGYDTQHYHIALDVDVDAAAIEGSTTITARALHALEAFYLDLWELEVREVTVDGRAAEVSRDGVDMRVTPARPIEAGATFEVVVRYGGKPVSVPSEAVPFAGGIGWMAVEGGVYVVSEPEGAASLFPCNDHPLDKATYSFALTAAKPYTAVANGLPTGVEETGDTRTFHWRATDPMASYLAMIAVAEFDHVVSEGPDGLPLHDYFHVSEPEASRVDFTKTADMIAFFASRFGPYPFESYGAIVAHAPVPGALETQTRPVYGMQAARESTIAHELAHQWFGNHVSPARWQDVWLNEGFAMFSYWLWERHTQGEERFAALAQRSSQMVRRVGFGSPAQPALSQLFGGAVYGRGPCVLFQLHQVVGDEGFDAIMRAFLERHGGGTATTGDWLAVVREVGGDEAHDVAHAALFEDVLPPAPGERNAEDADG